MRHPSVKLQLLANELCFLFSFRCSLLAITHFHNDFIVMNSFLFILLGIHSNYCTAGLRSLFTFLLCLYMYIFFCGKGLRVPWYMGRPQRTICQSLFSPSTRGLNSGNQAWWPALLLAETSHWSPDWDVFHQFYEIPTL